MVGRRWRHVIAPRVQISLFLLTLTWFTVHCVEPTGDYVCARLETYEVPEEKLVRRPYVIRESVWCMKIPPRCTKTRTEYRTDTITEMVTKSKVVRECCLGYEQQEVQCRPKCSEPCGPHGRCVAPDVCKCDPGFHGAFCNQGYEIILPPIFDSSPRSTNPSSGTDPSTSVPTISTLVTTQSTMEISSTTSYVTKSNTNLDVSSVTFKANQSHPLIEASTTSLTNADSVTERELSTELSSSENVTFTTEVSSTSSRIFPTAMFQSTASSIETLQSEVSDTGRFTNVASSKETSQNVAVTVETSQTVFPSNENSPSVSTGKETSQIAESTTETIPNITSTIDASTRSKDATSPTEDNSTKVGGNATYAGVEYIATNATINFQNFTDDYYELLHTKQQQNATVTDVSTTAVTSTSVDESTLSDWVTEASVDQKGGVTKSSSKFVDIDLLITLAVIIGGSLITVVITLLVLMLCQHRGKKTAPITTKQKREDSPAELKSLPNIVHSQLPPTPRDSGYSSSVYASNGGGQLVIVQHVTMATTNTFKPAPNQATISPALREALEAHYDHPPSVSSPVQLARDDRASLTSSQRSPSLAALWDAVMSTANQNDEEHVYDEIPCWNPRLYQRVPTYDMEQSSRC